jgi:hypothetical protein
LAKVGQTGCRAERGSCPHLAALVIAWKRRFLAVTGLENEIYTK